LESKCITSKSWHGLVTTRWIFLKGNEYIVSVLIVLIYWCGSQ
jgi:hypothetical protein